MQPPDLTLIQWSELLANAVVCFGLISGLIGAVFYLNEFLRERSRDREQRRVDTFTSLSSIYLDYLRLCIEHPELECVEAKDLPPGSSEDDRKQALLMQFVISMLEASYFFYSDHGADLREAQQVGWTAYAKDWCRHPEFIKRWEGAVDQYDRRFADYMRDVYAKANPSEA